MNLVPEYKSIVLSKESRIKLDSFLLPFCTGTQAQAAISCRLALNIRAIAFGKAQDKEEIIFTKEEYDFLYSIINKTKLHLESLLKDLE